MRVLSRFQLGLPAYMSDRIRWLSKFVNPNAARLTRLIRLSAASVAALDTRAWCQFEIWVRRRQMVRPSRLTSLGR